MTIEYVDPSVASVTQLPQIPPSAKLLVGFDEKLVRLSSDLDENLQKLIKLNQRLFGGDGPEQDPSTSSGANQSGGLLSSLDTRVVHLDRLIDKISKEMDSLDSLA